MADKKKKIISKRETVKEEMGGKDIFTIKMLFLLSLLLPFVKCLLQT